MKRFLLYALFIVPICFGIFVSHAEAASKYWVGGTGTWDATAGNKWATTSGGNTTTTVPTSADNCFFDANSTGTVTIGTASCGNLDFTGFTQTATGTSALTLSGNLTYGSGMTRGYTGTITINATSTIVSNGTTGLENLTINASGTVTLGDDYNISTKQLLLTAGGFDANNHNVTIGSFSSSNSNVRSLTMSSSTWTLTTSGTIWSLSTITNLTFSAGTSRIVVSDSSASTKTLSFATLAYNDLVLSGSGSGTFSISAGGATFHDVSVSNTGGASFSCSCVPLGARHLDFSGFTGTWANNGTVTLTGNLTLSPTMTNSYLGGITLNSSSSSNIATITTNTNSFFSTFTVNTSGTVRLGDNFVGASSTQLLLTAGTFDGNNQNFTIGSFSSVNSNIRTVTQGSGIWTITGTGTIWGTSTNTNLTYTTAPSFTIQNASTTTKTVTGATNDVFGGITIASSTAGTVNLNNGSTFGNVNVSSTVAGSIFTWASTGSTFNNLNFAGFTGTWNGSAAANIKGNLILGSGMTASSTATLTFNNTSTASTSTITSNGIQNLLSPVTINTSGTVQLMDAFHASSTKTLTLTAGTFDANNQNVTVGFFSSSNSGVRTLNMGLGAWNITGNSGTVWATGTVTNLTLNGASTTVNFSYVGSTGTRSIIASAASSSGTGMPAFAVTAGTDIVQNGVNTALWRSLDLTGFAGTFSGSQAINFTAGNLTISTSTNWTATGALFFLATSGVQTVTTNGVSLTSQIIENGAGGTLNFADTLVSSATVTLTAGTLTAAAAITATTLILTPSGSTFTLGGNLTLSGALTLTAGTLNANNKNVTIASLSSNNSNTRSVNMGSGTWTLTGTGTIWNATNTGFTLTPGSSTVIVANTSTSTKGIQPGGATTTFSNIVIPSSTAGMVQLSLGTYPSIIEAATGPSAELNFSGAGFTFGNLDFTGFTGSWTSSGAISGFTGNLTLSPTMTRTYTGAITFTPTATSTITTNGVILGSNVTINASGTVQLQDNLMSNTTSTLTVTAGTFDANNHNVSVGSLSSNNSNTRSILMGSGTWSLGGTGTIWTTATNTGLTLSADSSTVMITDTSATQKTIGIATTDTLNALNITSSTGGTINLTVAGNFGDVTDASVAASAVLSMTSGATVRNLNFTGFTGTWAGAAGSLNITGNLTLGSGMTRTYTGPITFAATSSIKTITSNGKSLASAVAFDGVSGSWQLADAFATTGAITLTNGSFDTNSQNVSSTSFISTSGSTRALNLGSTIWTVTGASTSSWNISTPTGMSLIPGVSTIKFTDTSSVARSFQGGSLTYNNVWFNGAFTGALTITGSNTFNTFTVDTPPHTIKFDDGSTQTVTSFAANGAVGNLNTIQSVASSTHYLVKSGGGTVDGSYLSVYNSHASPADTWYAGGNFEWVDGGGNTGWIFPPVVAVTVNASGAGSGTVTSDTGGISIPYPGSTSATESLSHNSSITITAVSSAGQVSDLQEGCQAAGGTVTKTGTETSVCTLTSPAASSTIPVVFLIPATVGTGGQIAPPGGGGGSGGGGGYVPPVIATSTTPVVPPVANPVPEVYASTTSFAPQGCPVYLGSYIKWGVTTNKISDVKALQTFLNQEFSLTLPVLGVYDTATKNAVIKFQEKYAKDILEPWGETKGTGYVYLTTARKINWIHCQQLGIQNYVPPTIATTTIQIAAPSSGIFTRTLQSGSIGEDVRALQKYLNNHGFAVATSGPGSKGNETTKFGLGTAQALIKFQEAHAQEILKPAGFTKGTGIFGSGTRKYVESHP